MQGCSCMLKYMGAPLPKSAFSLLMPALANSVILPICLDCHILMQGYSYLLKCLDAPRPKTSFFPVELANISPQPSTIDHFPSIQNQPLMPPLTLYHAHLITQANV